MKKSQERKHHPFSPSKLANLEVCPCYESRESSHVRTIAGTLAHKVAETGEDDHRLSDEDAAAAAECMDFVEQRRLLMQARADAFHRQLGGNPKKYRIKEFKESYLPVDDISFGDGEKSTTAGYVDLCLMDWDGKYAELVDYKFGLWPVEEAKSNLQGLAYILGLFKAYPKLESIRLFFKQPLLQSISEALVTRADIPAIYLRIQVVVARAREARKAGDYSMANPTVPVCNFCANIGKCTKVAELALKVGNKFHPLGVPDNITPTMIMSTKDTTLCVHLAQAVSIWADAFKRQLNDRVLRGECEVPPGMKLQTRQDREIVDPDAFQSVVESYIGPAAYIKCCTPAFGKVEDEVSDRAERGQKSAAIKELGEELMKKGAVKLGEPYAFLKSVPVKAE